MKKIIQSLVIILLMNVGYAIADKDVSSLSLEERRLLIASLYLGQCSVFHNNFFEAIKHFEPGNVQSIPDSGVGRKRFFDSFANASISIGKDACIVNILTDEFDKIAGGLKDY